MLKLHLIVTLYFHRLSVGQIVASRFQRYFSTLQECVEYCLRVGCMYSAGTVVQCAGC